MCCLLLLVNNLQDVSTVRAVSIDNIYPVFKLLHMYVVSLAVMCAVSLAESCVCRSTGWWRVPGSYICPVCVGVPDGGGCQGATCVLCV